MGWFWGSNDDTTASSKDALGGLDPSLREFLKKESPIRYESSNPPAAPQTKAPEVPKIIPAVPKASENSAPAVPKESQFQDGRYADLWKTYRPKAEIEAEGKSEQEKLMDILEGYQHRKQEIGRVALENCVFEQMEVSDCFRQGTWSARTQMCRDENRKFERCYMMQAKFLKALGYLSTFERPPEVDERIQMHADTLYHRMLEQEKAIELAKAEGKPVPVFLPLLSKRDPKLPQEPTPGPEYSKVKGTPLEISDFSGKFQTEIKKRLDKLEGADRELEERAIKAELQAGTQTFERLDDYHKKQNEERKARKEQGKETFGDRLVSIFRTW